MTEPIPPFEDEFATDCRPEAVQPTVLGEYILLREIGRGGMGIVYEAQHRSSSNMVALKTLANSEHHSLHRFKQEFRVLADLTHPNLVQLGELVTTEREPFFTMEFIQGLRFDEYVAARADSWHANTDSAFAAGFDESRLRSSLSQLVDGLNALHRDGNLHRDLKPNNVLVSREGRLVILDFGLAVEMKDGVFHNFLREFAGTPVYMAPEQASGRTVTSAADWYSVGVMLYQAMTGKLPFEKGTFEQLQQAKWAGPPASPQSLVPYIPNDLNELCLELLRSNPDDRPTGEEIANRLHSSSISIRPASTWIGRELQLGQLRAEWEQTRQGIGRVVFVTGRSGLGKSSLVNRFLKEVADSEQVVILRGRCYENETVAYRGFDSLVDSLVRYLQRLSREQLGRATPIEINALCQLFPVLAEVHSFQAERVRTRVYSDSLEIRRRGIAGLRELLMRLANWEPVVVFIEDLHWGDDDTALIVRELTQAESLPKALFIGTFRSEDMSNNRCLNLIRREVLPPTEQVALAEQVELRVDRLSEAEAVQLATELLSRAGRSLPSIVAKIVSEADGDPLFIHVLVQYVLNTTGDNASIATKVDAIDLWDQDNQNSKSLTEVLWHEISDLPLDQRQAIELVSAAGRPVPRLAIEQIIVFEHDATTALRALRIKRFVRQMNSQGDVEIYHDRIRETVVNRLSRELLQEYCGRLADVMESTSGLGNAEFLGDLFHNSGRPEKAGRYYIEAGKHAMSILAFHRAAELFRQAIDDLQPVADRELELRKLYAEALANSSRNVDSAKEYLRAAELADESTRPDLLQQAALRFLTSGHVDAGVEALIQALESVKLRWPRTTAGAVLGLLRREAWLRLRGLRARNTLKGDGKYPEISNHASSKKEVQDGPSNVRSQAGSIITPRQHRRLRLCWSAAAGLSVVDPVRGSYFMAENLCIALQDGASSHILRALAAYVGHVAIGGNRSRGAVHRVLSEARRVARKESHPYYIGTLLTARGVAALLRGRWSLALRCSDRALEYLHDERCLDVNWEISTARTFALWSLQYQGKLAELSHRQPELLRIARETNDLFASLNFGTQVMTHLQLAIGQPDEARARLNEDAQRLSQRGFFVQHHNYLLANSFIDLYEGNGQDALERLQGQWIHYQKSFLSRVQQIRIDYVQLHCRSALAAVASGYHRQQNLKLAGSLVQQLRRERIPWATALAQAFHSSWLQLRGDSRAAKASLVMATSQLAQVQMYLFAAACRHHLANRFCDAESSDNSTPVQANWEQLGVVKSPERMAAAILPGFNRD